MPVVKPVPVERKKVPFTIYLSPEGRLVDADLRDPSSRRVVIGEAEVTVWSDGNITTDTKYFEDDETVALLRSLNIY